MKSRRLRGHPCLAAEVLPGGRISNRYGLESGRGVLEARNNRLDALISRPIHRHRDLPSDHVDSDAPGTGNIIILGIEHTLPSAGSDKPNYAHACVSIAAAAACTGLGAALAAFCFSELCWKRAW